MQQADLAHSLPVFPSNLISFLHDNAQCAIASCVILTHTAISVPAPDLLAAGLYRTTASFFVFK